MRRNLSPNASSPPAGYQMIGQPMKPVGSNAITPTPPTSPGYGQRNYQSTRGHRTMPYPPQVNRQRTLSHDQDEIRQ